MNIPRTKFFAMKTLHSVSNDRTSAVSSKPVLRVCESMKENCIEIRLVELIHDLASVIRIQAATRKPKIYSNGIIMRASAQKARPIHSLDLYMFVFYYLDGDSVADSSSISLLESPPSMTKLSTGNVTNQSNIMAYIWREDLFC